MREPNRSPRSLGYWIPTALVALNWTFGGVSSVLRTASSMEVYRYLGYPSYFATLLGTAQLLGVFAILVPVPRTLREWAYAGLTFDVGSAIVSSLAVGAGEHFELVAGARPSVTPAPRPSVGKHCLGRGERI